MADAFLSSQLPNPPALGAPAPTTAGLKLLVASRRCTSSMRMSSLRLCLTAISPRTLAPRSHRWPTGTLEDHIALGRLHVHLNTAGHLHSPNLHVPDLEVHIPAAVGPQEKLSTRSQCGGCCKAWRNQPISLAELRLGHVHHQLRQLYGEDLAACTVLGLQRKPNYILCIYVYTYYCYSSNMTCDVRAYSPLTTYIGYTYMGLYIISTTAIIRLGSR